MIESLTNYGGIEAITPVTAAQRAKKTRLRKL